MHPSLQSTHPFSQFDLAAIGIVLVAVMVIMAARRLYRAVFPPSRQRVDPRASLED